jgi:hypothetical protein
MGEVGLGLDQRIEVVAPDTPLHLGVTQADFLRLGLGESQHALPERCRCPGIEPHRRGFGRERIDRKDVIDHLAIDERPGPAGIVAGHAANRAARCG